MIQARTAQPTLIFVGDDDGALRYATDFKGIEECFTGPLKIVHVPNAGHFVPAEQPDAVLAELVPFLIGGLAPPKPPLTGTRSSTTRSTVAVGSTSGAGPRLGRAPGERG